MKRVLITGATGNIGTEVIRYLQPFSGVLDIVAGVRNMDTDRRKFTGYPIGFTKFDFTNIESYGPALSNCNIPFSVAATSNFAGGKILQTTHVCGG